LAVCYLARISAFIPAISERSVRRMSGSIANEVKGKEENSDWQWIL
jgi:hypothetical protein